LIFKELGQKCNRKCQIGDYSISGDGADTSGFIRGNITTSLKLSCSVKIANILSNHIPKPD
jgi:hypothetical protein